MFSFTVFGLTIYPVWALVGGVITFLYCELIRNKYKQNDDE